ncbi:MAG: hypothetical protein FWF63_11135 [Fibromonadales bacterium]|nr:hypothetical protein [Fibromonadales bacterium]
MKKIAPLILFVVFAVFAQQQNKAPAPTSAKTAPAPVPSATPQPIPQEIIPEPVVPLVPAQPIPEQLIQTAPPQPPQPVLLPIDPKDTLPLPPLPPLPPMPLPDTLSTPAATDSASVVPAPAPLPQDTTPQQAAPPKVDSASIVPTPAPKDTTPPKPSLPMNTITVDLGPTIIGVAAEETFKIFGKSKLKGVEISALGFGVQYEFQPIRFLSLPLKFAYMGFKANIEENKTIDLPKPELKPEQLEKIDSLRNVLHVLDSLKDLGLDDPRIDTLRNQLDMIDNLLENPIPIDGSTKLTAELNIWSIEAHPRLYPFGGSFFLEGMVGYSKLTTTFEGNANVEIKFPNGIDIPDVPELQIPKDTVYQIDVNHKASRNYLKYGGKLGWRVDFGKPGGLVFEHALGWYFAKGFGKTIVKQLIDYAEDKVDGEIAKSQYKDIDYKSKVDIKKFDDAFSLLEQFGLVGGPRYTFAFGWRF